MSDIHIVTVSTSPQYYFPYLVESCKKNGKGLEVVGNGEKWEGLNWKMKKMIEYLAPLPDSDIVCFIDGYDVLCTRDLTGLKTVFLDLTKKHGCKVVVGHDKQSMLWSFNYLFYGTCKQLSVNSGTYMGQVKDLKIIIYKIYALNQESATSDQRLMTQYCVKNPDDFYIDVHNEVFLDLLYPFEDLSKYVDIQDGALSKDGNRPFFIHAAGYGILDNVLLKLGYHYDGNIKEQYYKNVVQKKFMMYVKMIAKENKGVFVFLLFIALIVLLVFFRKSIFKKMQIKKLRFPKMR